MEKIEFTKVENRIREILDRKDHKDVEIKEMWPESQRVVINLGYKKAQGQIVIPIEHFDDKLWLDIESKINYAANQLKRKATIKKKKK